MVFEMLHKDLHNTIVSEDLEMQLTEIRAIARQVHIIANGNYFLLKTYSYFIEMNMKLYKLVTHCPLLW